MRTIFRWMAVGIAAAAVRPAPAAPPAPPAASKAAVPSLLPRALAGPWREVGAIVFCTRTRYDDGHWYANIGYYCDDENRKAYAGNGAPDDGKLCRLDVRTGEVTVLLDAKGGSVRDPQVHYDGRTILFSHRPAGTDHYHLYEIGADGSGLRQVTDGAFDDIEPAYLPDGDIVFVSTRCRRWVNCWYTQVATMHRCDADGRGIRSLSANTEHDNTPWVLPDGRLLYMRWEYVDRSQVEYHALWASNPDGTGQTIFYGNMHSWIVMLDAKPIPGTADIVATFSPGHGRNEHAGTITVVSAARGPDDRSMARALHKGADHRDPWALSPDLFMAATGNRIVLLDTQGRQETLYTHPGGTAVHEPRPIQPRPREPIVCSKVRPEEPTGRLVLADVYRGRNLPGVKRGEIRKLLVLESLPKPVNFSGGMDLTSWSGTFTLERVLGTVPVEADGSAYFEAPAMRQLFLVALDERDLSVKRMQSWMSVMPGETLSCVGCHEERVLAPEGRPGGRLEAMARPPSRIRPFEGLPDVPDFHRDVQPILDRHCVSCHGPERHAGGLSLAGDLGPHWAISYFSLLARRQVADGRNGLGNQAPRTIGSSASPLLQKAGGGHHEVKTTPAEWRTLWLWIEAGAPYAGSYAGLRNTAQQNLAGAAHGAAMGGVTPVLRKRCAECHGGDGPPAARAPAIPYVDRDRREEEKRAGHPLGQYERVVFENDPMARYSANVILNLSRPECSALLLAPLAKPAGGWESCGAVFKDRGDPDYQAILAALRRGQAAYGAPRWGEAGFQPNPQYVREMKKYGILPADFDPARGTIDFFDTDQRYWESFWHRPPPLASAPR